MLLILPQNSMQNALSITNLSKIYNGKTHALKGIDLTVKKGDFFALLGSNGAGKTTAIGIICGLLNKTNGVVEVLGFDQDNDPNMVKKMIGVMPQEFNFNPFEPIEEILLNQAGYHGIRRQDAKIQTEFLLKKVNLWGKRFDMAKSLSGGMKRRLILARALVHQPKILILDEPTAGVDVEIRHSMWEFLRELNKDGMTVILTTHYFEEAESLCKNIAILDRGKVVEQSSMKKMLSKISHQVLILESKNTLPDSIIEDKFTCEKLDDFSIKVILEADTNISDALQNLAKQGISIEHVRSAQNRLETLFLCLTNQNNKD